MKKKHSRIKTFLYCLDNNRNQTSSNSPFSLEDVYLITSKERTPVLIEKGEENKFHSIYRVRRKKFSKPKKKKSVFSRKLEKEVSLQRKSSLEAFFFFLNSLKVIQTWRRLLKSETPVALTNFQKKYRIFKTILQSFFTTKYLFFSRWFYNNLCVCVCVCDPSSNPERSCLYFTYCWYTLRKGMHPTFSLML